MSKYTNREIAERSGLWDEYYNTRGMMPFDDHTFDERLAALDRDYPEDDEAELLAMKAASASGKKGGRAKSEAKTKAEQIIEDIRAQGFDDQQILDGLCDGEALTNLGYTDDDQEDIEAACDIIRGKLAAKLLGKKGGKVKSQAKTKTAVENGKKGGRPKKKPPVA